MPPNVTGDDSQKSSSTEVPCDEARGQMGRNLVVLADGTGNSAAKLFKTNVWRIYQALDLGGADQLAAFSDGVGTSNFKPFQLIGLALGFGVKRRVLALYKFLCLNYEPGDNVYAFGFSRGAFTIRVLVGLIASEGLVAFKSQEELDRNALAAYRSFRRIAFPAGALFWVTLSRAVRDVWVAATNKVTGSRGYDHVRPEPGSLRAPDRIRVRFMGVWDTVSAYGLPVDELTKAVDKWVWPMTFERRNLLALVDKARQAFSIDDERRTFFPIPWDEIDQGVQSADSNEAPRLLQVWFAGSHANVGGGYADDRLAHIPLCWMIAEAAASGLRFKPEIVADYWEYASPSGRLYDSRSGFGVFYRYHPRSSKHLMGSSTPLIDSSVILRMHSGADAYAPISLPDDVRILTVSGAQIPFADSEADEKVAGRILADNLPLPADRRRDLERMDGQLATALAALKPTGAIADRQERVEQMLDTVWWRRGLYYVMLCLAVLFAVFPLFAGYVTLDTAGRIDLMSSGVVGPVAGLLKGILPGFTAPWVDAIAEHAFLAVLLGAAFAICLWLSSLLKTRIHDRARVAWNVEVYKAPESTTDRRDAQQRVALAGSLAFGLAALVLWLAGNAAAAWLGIAFVACVLIMFLQRGKATADRPFFLRVARSVRKSRLAQMVYNLLREQILPATFLVLSLSLAALLINKVAFQVASSTGATCPEPLNLVEDQSELLAASSIFKTSSLCYDTGSWLQEGVHYRIAIDITNDWNDGTVAADTLGTKGGFVHYLGSLFKRWWGQSWFKPIARVGRYGNDEYVLEPFQQAISRSHQGNKSLIAEIVPRQSGELYLYVNDAVVGVPHLFDSFYVNNTGEAKVSVTKAYH